MKVVLVGPISGMPNFNDENFARVQAELERRGNHEVWSPHQRTPAQVAEAERRLRELGDGGGIDASVVHAYWMRISLAKIVTWAEALCVLDGWENSRGALLEMAIGYQVGLVVGTEDGFTLDEFEYHFTWKASS